MAPLPDGISGPSPNRKRSFDLDIGYLHIGEEQLRQKCHYSKRVELAGASIQKERRTFAEGIGLVHIPKEVQKLEAVEWEYLQIDAAEWAERILMDEFQEAFTVIEKSHEKSKAAILQRALAGSMLEENWCKYLEIRLRLELKVSTTTWLEIEREHARKRWKVEKGKSEDRIDGHSFKQSVQQLLTSKFEQVEKKFASLWDREPSDSGWLTEAELVGQVMKIQRGEMEERINGVCSKLGLDQAPGFMTRVETRRKRMEEDLKACMGIRGETVEEELQSRDPRMDDAGRSPASHAIGSRNEEVQ